MKKSHFLQRIFVCMMAFLIPSLSVISTYALSEETLDRYAASNILFYDPDGGTSTCSGGSYVDGPIPLMGTTPEEKIWSGLTTFLTPEQAAGVMGNMQSESGFNPAQHEIGMMKKYWKPGFALNENTNISYGLGLVQWSFGRRAGMYNFVYGSNSSLVEYFNNPEKYSPDYWSGSDFINAAGEEAFDDLVSLELQYLKDELNNNSNYRGLLETTTVYDATKFFLEHVEVPKNPNIESHPGRVTQAEAIYERLKDSDFTGGCNLQGLASFVKAYAWPEYRGGGFIERRSEYAEAVERRASAGKYVGGTVNNIKGIDCGGFVTTIMQESGYDPDYNGCKSNTGPQEYWLREGGGSDKWIWLNPDGKPMNAADLQLGDVAFTGGYTGSCSAGGEHTYMFIGSDLGFQTSIVSASYGGSSSARAPMSGRESLNARWYRKVR